MLEVQLMPETLYRFSPSKSHRLDVHVRASTRFKLQQEILRGRTADLASLSQSSVGKALISAIRQSQLSRENCTAGASLAAAYSRKSSFFE